MRGGITITEAYGTSFKDRKIINEIITENLKTTKDTGMPFF